MAEIGERRTDKQDRSPLTALAAPDWSALARPVPSWFTDAKFGIFIHWGPYSVPGWAEPRGELGSIADAEWYARNPYAEWYWNSLKISDSPTAAHHRAVFGDAPYDAFLDSWHAERFDAGSLMGLCSRAGARYVIPTTKHHDGVALWAAPDSGSRNAVARGPRRDLITEMAEAARAAQLRFGVYYSGGLDWGFAPGPPIESRDDLHRPVDARYARYAYRQVLDLIDRHVPDLLWNDIDWPDAGKTAAPFGLFDLLTHYRRTVPEGVINDRWGVPLYDFRTSEYQAHRDSEVAAVWEHCRGIGYSFGNNRLEGRAEYLTPRNAIRLLVDVVSRGGNLLLNVGPRADGTLPDLQRDVLEGLALWMRDGSSAIHASHPVRDAARYRSEDPWIRWTVNRDSVFAIFDTDKAAFEINDIPAEADPDEWTGPVHVHRNGRTLAVRRSIDTQDGAPVVIRFARSVPT